MLSIRTTGGREVRTGVSASTDWSGLGMTTAIPPHGWATPNKANVPVFERTVTQLTPVNACVRILTGYFLAMGDMQPYTVAYDSFDYPYNKPIAPIPTFLSDPFGPFVISAEGWASVIYSMFLFSEVFLLTITRDPRTGAPTAVKVLPTPMVDVKNVAGVKTYVLGLGGNNGLQILDPADVTHIRLTVRPGHLRSTSSLVANNLAYALYSAAYQYGLTFFGQGASPSFILSTPNKLPDDVAQRIVDKLIIEHSGLDMAHLPLLLDSGVTAQKIGTTPDEAQFLQTSTAAALDIATYAGVPISWLGLNGPEVGSNSSRLQEVTGQFVTGTLQNYFLPISQHFSRMLPGAQQCAFNTRKLTRATGADLAKELTAARLTGTFSPDMALREFYGIGPMPNGEGAALAMPLASNQSPEVTAGLAAINAPSGGNQS